MKSNTMIRTLTLTFIVFCFIAMFVLASFSAKADLRPASAGTGFIELSADNVQAGVQPEYLSSFSAESTGADSPTI